MKRYFSHPGTLQLLLGLGLAFAGGLTAAEPDEPDSAPQLSQAQLDQLLGPIALYPDPLVALILPASTSPADIVLAARYLNANGDPGQIDSQPWSESVKSLARYPEIVKWMDENLHWTKELGGAFLAQPADVMNAMQRLRAQARATGALTDTPQQQVVMDGSVIEIVPAQPDVIYVPIYDPEIVYVRQTGYYAEPFLTFSLGFSTGFWLSYDFDWRTRTIWMGDRRRDWRDHWDWLHHPAASHRPGGLNNTNWHPWKPSVNRTPLPPRDQHSPRWEVIRPRPFSETRPNSQDSRSSDNDRSRTGATIRVQEPNRLPGPPGSGTGQIPHDRRPDVSPPATIPQTGNSNPNPAHATGSFRQPPNRPDHAPPANPAPNAVSTPPPSRTTIRDNNVGSRDDSHVSDRGRSRPEAGSQQQNIPITSGNPPPGPNPREGQTHASPRANTPQATTVNPSPPRAPEPMRQPPARPDIAPPSNPAPSQRSTTPPPPPASRDKDGRKESEN